MTTLFSKLFLWLKDAAVYFVLILGVISVIYWYNIESPKTGGSCAKEKQQRALSEKTSVCDAIKNDLEELKRAHPLAIRMPFTRPYKDGIAIKAAVAACDVDLAEIKSKLDGFEAARAASFYSKFVEPNIPNALIALLLLFADSEDRATADATRRSPSLLVCWPSALLLLLTVRLLAAACLRS